MAVPERLNPDSVHIAEGKDVKRPPHVENINAFTTDVLIAQTRQVKKPFSIGQLMTLLPTILG